MGFQLLACLNKQTTISHDHDLYIFEIPKKLLLTEGEKREIKDGWWKNSKMDNIVLLLYNIYLCISFYNLKTEIADLLGNEQLEEMWQNDVQSYKISMLSTSTGTTGSVAAINTCVDHICQYTSIHLAYRQGNQPLPKSFKCIDQVKVMQCWI